MGSQLSIPNQKFNCVICKDEFTNENSYEDHLIGVHFVHPDEAFMWRYYKQS